MLKKDALLEIRRRFEDITSEMSQPEVATDPDRMAGLGREHVELRPIVETIDRYLTMLREREDLREMVKVGEDDELVEMAESELEQIEERLPALERNLRLQLVPRDPQDARDVILEVRAGTGGDEAALFAGDLFRLYSHYAENRNWRIEVIDASEGTQGGFKEIIFSVRGTDAYGWMKFESGVHRVQRVPATEASGRIHTSAATVAVLPEAEEVDVQISPNDLKIDVYRSSGPGGQSVNTTDSAVRITHIPTGLVVTCQDEKSQHKNKDKALRVLRSRLYDLKLARQNAERDEARRSMVGTGDRSAKIRTYNFPQDRVTDHRLTGDEKNYPLHQVMDGDLDPIIQALRAAESTEKLARF